ncbi:hypothetical protein [Halalkalibacillus sediminis]|uniref:hypothetical protein n=1 Tax=Halalkalibacillus sediminis TaxID=2018042 RepID=UPI00138FD552|nr:hypothetical protein [Halalkalibacillus sediminis]
MNGWMFLLFAVLTVSFFLLFLNARRNNKPKWVVVTFTIATLGFLWWTGKYFIALV